MRRLAVVLLGSLVLACDGVTVSLEGNPFPVGSEDEAVFDAGLVGRWRSQAVDGEQPSELLIESDDLRSYRVSLREHGDDQALEMTAYVVDVTGVKYLNGRLVSRPGLEATGWALLRYWYEVPDRLVVASPESSAFSGCDANSAQALLDCVRRHPPDSRDWEAPTTYERVSLVTTHLISSVQPTAGSFGIGTTKSANARRR